MDIQFKISFFVGNSNLIEEIMKKFRLFFVISCITMRNGNKISNITIRKNKCRMEEERNEPN